MEFSGKLSLQHQTLVKIVAILWNQSDVKILISKMQFSPNILPKSVDWQEVQGKVIEKVHKLPVPKLFKEKLLDIIEPVGDQIFYWLEFHYRCNFIKKQPNVLKWTSQGLIDKKKMAEILVNDESLGIYRRYKIACIYCLEENIYILWKHLLQNDYKEDIERMTAWNDSFLVCLWSLHLQREARFNDNVENYSFRRELQHIVYECGFRISGNSGNEVATKYFFERLTSEEKKENLVEFATTVAKQRFGTCKFKDSYPKYCYSSVLCFLLSEMDNEQQIKLFKSEPCYVLKCLLDWPCQDYFVKTIKHMLPFLSGDHFSEILLYILHKTFDCYTGNNYQELFTVFWQQGQKIHKRYALDHFATKLISLLFKIPSERNFKLILQAATDTEKEKFILGESGLVICQNLICNEKWDVLEVFIRECILSNYGILKFRSTLKECYKNFYNEVSIEMNEIWNNFFLLLENYIHVSSKRKAEENKYDSEKRLCNLEL